jgi:hypothetical protein
MAARTDKQLVPTIQKPAIAIDLKAAAIEQFLQ